MTFVRLLVLLLALGIVAVRAQSPDEQYIRIYQVIQDADRLNDSGQTRAAAAKYLEAQDGLRRFQTTFPGWNERVVTFRLNYVNTKLAPLSAAIAAAAARTNVPPATQTPAPAPAPPAAQPPAVAVTPTPAPTPTPTPAPAETPPAPQPVAPPPIAAPPKPAVLPTPTPATVSPEIQEQIGSLRAEVDRLKMENSRVMAENNRLGAKLKEALSVQPAAVDPKELARAEDRIRSLEKENDLIRVRLKMAINPAPTPGESVAELRAQLAQQNESIAALRAENNILKQREQQNASTPVPSPAPAPAPAPAVPAASTTAPPQVPPATALEIETLRARVATLEAQPLPYTPEELALFKTTPAPGPSTALSATTAPPPAEGGPRKASKEIPPGAGPLVAAAQRASATRNFAEAEKKYLEVLRQDENNVASLANVAAAQVNLGKLAEAETNIRKALALDPDDDYVLHVLGRIKFQQEKWDEALDAFSRSGRINPNSAENQNYIGVVLAEKGLRVPAEAALRRALQIDPNYAAAHNNLAAIYASQKPPALALAKWHYQRALAAGSPKDPDLEKMFSEK